MKERAGTVPAESGSRLTSAELDAGGPGSVPADEYAYQYDDIGNRITSTDLGTNRTYTANFLNQYTLISNLCDSVTLCDDFVPQYDLDGNQTLVKTSTGVWQVSYNGENRPVSWTCGTTNIVMAYDRMGRRVLSRETVGGAVTDSNFSFVYDGYLCIQRLNATTRNVKLIFTWDPLEKVATKPLMVEKPGKYKMHVTHDGNKNVSELVFFSGGSGIAAHYEYAPFGALTASTRSTSVTAYDLRTYNPFRFSSEYADDTLGLVYYNYRHYNPMDGRWTSRDPLFGKNKYLYVDNTIEGDFIGLWPCDDVCTEGAIEVDRVDIKTVPSLWDETYDAEGMISFIGKASTVTSMMSGGISGGMAGGVRYVGPTAVAEGLKSESDGNMIDLYVKLIKKSSGRFSGNKVYTRAHVKRCECVPCFFVWSRLDWVEEEGSWEPCKIGGVEFAGDYIIPNLTEKIINRCKDDRVNKELGIKSSKNGRMRR